MWIIFRNGIRVGDWKRNTFDIVYGRFSMFNGPNYIEWLTYNPSEELMTMSGTKDDFTFKYMDGNNHTEFEIQLKLVFSSWDHDKRGMLIRFEPKLLYYANLYIISKNPICKTIEDVMVDLLGRVNAKVIVASDIKNNELYNGYFHKGRIISFLDKFASDNNTEYYINDKFCAVGYIINNFKDLQANSVPTYTTLDNTISQVEVFKKKFTIATITQRVIKTIGDVIILNDGTPQRVISSYFRLDQNTIDSSIICNDYGVKVDQFTLAHLTKSVYKDDNMLQSIDSKYSNIDTFVSLTTEDTDEFEKLAAVSTISRDMRHMNITNTDITQRIVKSVPYAGDTVGIQYPVNIGSNNINVSHEGELSSSIEVGQVYQESLSPKRTAPEDFRLTLPDGGTLYYSAAKKEWAMITKTNIMIGVQSSFDNTKVPTDADLQAKITIKNGEIILDDGTRKITMNGSMVNVT